MDKKFAPEGIEQDDEGEDGPYVRGDDGAARVEHLTVGDIRKLRTAGKLAGAYAKFGHRTVVYHRERLRRSVKQAFEEA